MHGGLILRDGDCDCRPFADEAQENELRALVAPVAAIFLGAMYESELAELDDDEAAALRELRRTAEELAAGAHGE